MFISCHLVCDIFLIQYKKERAMVGQPNIILSKLKVILTHIRHCISLRIHVPVSKSVSDNYFILGKQY